MVKRGKRAEVRFCDLRFIACPSSNSPTCEYQLNTISHTFLHRTCPFVHYVSFAHSVGFSASFLPFSRWVVPWQCEKKSTNEWNGNIFCARSGRKLGVCANASTWEKQESAQTLRDEGRSEKRVLCLIFRPKVSSGSLELNRRAARVPLWCDTRANM